MRGDAYGPFMSVHLGRPTEFDNRVARALASSARWARGSALTLLAVVACQSARIPRSSPLPAPEDRAHQPLPELLRLPADYRTPLERVYGSKLVQVLPDTWLNVVDIGGEHPRTLVLVHGDAGSFDYWRPQIEYFKDRYRIVAYERAECGRSVGPAASLTYSASANHLTRLLHEVGVHSYVVIGHSKGQEIAAFHFATAAPGLVGLVAEGTAVSVSPDPAARSSAERAITRHSLGDEDLRLSCYAELNQRVRMFAAPMRVSPEGARDLLKYACGRWRPSAGIMGGPDVEIEEQLASVNLPMLQIDGDAYRQDRDRRQTMQRFFRNARLVTLVGVGHVPHLEAPDDFNHRVEQFLAEIGF